MSSLKIHHFFNYYIYLSFVGVSGKSGVNVPQCTCNGQMTSFQSWFSPAMWVQGIKLGSWDKVASTTPTEKSCWPRLVTFTKPTRHKWCTNIIKLLSFHQVSCVIFFSLLEPTRHLIRRVAMSSVNYIINNSMNVLVSSILLIQEY